MNQKRPPLQKKAIPNFPDYTMDVDGTVRDRNGFTSKVYGGISGGSSYVRAPRTKQRMCHAQIYIVATHRRLFPNHSKELKRSYKA